VPVTETQRSVPWSTAGLFVGVLAVAFATIGLVLAVYHAGSARDQLLEMARTEATHVRRTIRALFFDNTYTVLRAAAVYHDREAFRLAVPDVPPWVSAIVTYDGRVVVRGYDLRPGADAPSDAHTLRLLGEQARSTWERAVNGPRRAIDAIKWEDYDGQAVLTAVAAIPDREKGFRIGAAILETSQLDKDLIDGELRLASPRVRLAKGPASSDVFSLSLGSEFPEYRLEPTDRFVSQLDGVFHRPIAIQIAITVLPLASLLGVMWALARVARREMAVAQLKSVFVADVSHELKTPLALIRMFAETLMGGRVTQPDKAHEYYGIIVRESTRLTHLIDNLLDFSRIDSGRKPFRLRPIDIGQVVRDTFEAYRHELERQHFEHHLTVADGLPVVEADADAVSQALLNLMNNAVKYSDDDRFLAIDVTHETRRGRHGVLISVRDRGIGIKPEDRARVFDGFFRATDERVRKRRGAGLGLSLVKHIVDAHAGSVDVESRLVKGSTFRIFLPKAESPLAGASGNGEDGGRGAEGAERRRT